MQKVMETLLTKFQPGYQTHFYILTTLSDLVSILRISVFGR
jgi:hypothetical protein